MIKKYLFLICLLFPFLVEAKNGPLPQQIGAIKHSVLTQKKQCDTLFQEIDELNTKLQQLDLKIKTLKENLHLKENGIKEHQEKITFLTQRIEKLRTKKKILKQNEQSYTSLLLRLSKTPPQLFLGLDHSAHETVFGLHYLKSTLQNLKEKSLKYHKTKSNLQIDQQKLTKISTILSDEKEDLLKDQEDLHQQLNISVKLKKEKEELAEKEQKKLEALTCTMNSVKDLLKSVPKHPSQITTSPQSEQENFNPQKGNFIRPVAGKIIRQFNELDDQGHKSHGIRFEVEPACPVKAPFTGKVAFCGPFRHYSNIVIIEHGQEYHSLLMGLDNVKVIPGQIVQKNDLVGYVGITQKNEEGQFIKPILFLEFRQHLQPIDPMPWFSS
ncbi:MAG: peptidoglycan DD-metalloendopeptidase family protein [Alphaproteobacteria bacterium]|nr:peptidoglycan DD-metalloendopeptidase family protein [Alphaproteobacteria bacterium]